jgi:hypothetical protein
MRFLFYRNNIQPGRIRKVTESLRFCAYLLAGILVCIGTSPSFAQAELSTLKKSFLNPPDTAKPGVYWYFMDGNLTKASMTSDLESMKKAGIGNLVFLEVNVGIPRGSVDFLSDQWQTLFAHAVKEAKRLGIEITLGIGPGWTGSGGPWVKPAQSMQQLVSSTTLVSGKEHKKIILPVPSPKKPYFGDGAFTPELKKEWQDFYEDVAVLAYPTPSATKKLMDAEEKALYYRAPYSSAPGVKPYLLSNANGPVSKESIIKKNKIINLTGKLRKDGSLNWSPPSGSWTIVRFGRRNNGAITRPAPVPGLGFESDKFDTAAVKSHLDHYIGKLLTKTGKPDSTQAGGLKRLHMDSWEMGAQNWTLRFQEEFTKRRGYDPLPFYPVYNGSIVESEEISERFLWDLRQTAQELILENHAGFVKKYAKLNGMGLSIEPYDMNPTADLELGAVADVPMAEFWSKGLGFNSSFSCIEATSIGHVNGKTLIPAEAFTAQNDEGWKQHPGSMKNQGDWAFATGINRFVYHTFQNQFLADSLRPGATMGPYGIHWDRNQTWWPMVGSYHDYISRCQYILQQGRSVADLLYLTPEGSPHVFRPPLSAMVGDTIPDRKLYNFDGCPPGMLYKAVFRNGRIEFPGGASYRILVLPVVNTMTPALLEKIKSLVSEGATIVGPPPLKSPSLSGYPASDLKIQDLVKEVWGLQTSPLQMNTRPYGKGKVIWGGELSSQISNLYPDFDLTAKILKSMDVSPDFVSDGPLRYTHRTSGEFDIYFVSNTTDQAIRCNATFRSTTGTPQLWDPLTGAIKVLSEYTIKEDLTNIPLALDAYQSFFIVFYKGTSAPSLKTLNFPEKSLVYTLPAGWDVSFDPKWGGPKKVRFEKLQDWTQRPEDGVKYYSGTAVYQKVFDLPKSVDLRSDKKIFLNLGKVKNLARVKLNGQLLQILWTAPWSVDITSALTKKGNTLEIEVINLWPNRLIGDERLPDDGIVNDQWPDWIKKGLTRPSKRFTFSTHRFYDKNSPLLESGLIGPVTILQEDEHSK